MMRALQLTQRSSRNHLHSICTRSKTTASRNAIQVVNPYSGEIHCEVAKSDFAEANVLLDKSVEMQKEWWGMTGATIGLVERQRICTQFVDQFEKYTEEIAHDISSMMGKPLQQSRNEIAGTRERATAMIEMSTQFLSDMPVPPKIGFDRKIRKEPLGSILIVAPWNYPLLCTVNSLIPAILSGNSVILKLSSKTPLVANHFIRALEAAGCPEGLVIPLHCDHDTTTQVEL